VVFSLNPAEAEGAEVGHEGREGSEGHEGWRRLSPELEALSREVVDAGLKVHRALGPGLLESVYEQCLVHELRARGRIVASQVPVPVRYEGIKLEVGYRLDVLVEDVLIIEVKATENILRLYEAQLLTYLRLSGRRLGILMNFNVELFKRGLRRVVL